MAANVWGCLGNMWWIIICGSFVVDDNKTITYFYPCISKTFYKTIFNSQIAKSPLDKPFPSIISYTNQLNTKHQERWRDQGPVKPSNRQLHGANSPNAVRSLCVRYTLEDVR